MNLIDDIRQLPNTGRLFIVWQISSSNSSVSTGERFVVGEILYNDEFEQVNYFDNEDIKKAENAGFQKIHVFSGHEGIKFTNHEISNALAKRAMSKERDDFDSYVKSYMISPSLKDQLDTLTLLANTGRGQNFGDGFSFFPDIKGMKLPFQVTFEAAGHRHTEGMEKFNDKMTLTGRKVTFELDDDNNYDQYAIKILLDGIIIGYVPKGINKGIRYFIESGNKIEGIVARVNGTIDRPNLIILAKISQP